MEIRISRDFGPLDELELLTQDDLRELGLLMRERIVRRTLRGLDVQNVPFAPYSADYLATKAEELGIASPVNLQVSGNMLNHLQIVAIETDGASGRVRLGWTQ